MNRYKEYDILSPIAKEDMVVTDVQGDMFYLADGSYKVDMDEMRVVLGQKNENFEQAIVEALRKNTTLRQSENSVQERLYRYLDETTNHDFEAVYLTSSGSEAVEAAVRIAQNITGKSEIITFWNSIHGRTYLSSSMSGLPKRRLGLKETAPGIISVPYPKCSECPLHKKGKECGFACLDMVKKTYESASTKNGAAVFVEAYQGAGVILPPNGYLEQLQRWTHEQGMLFVLDEIQSGMGRTGKMYVYQEERLQPDILLLGKALGNGFHIAAVLNRRRPEKEILPALAGGAGADPIACAAACEVFSQLEQGLLQAVKKKGGLLNQGLKKLEDSILIQECRGRGLAAAVEFYEEETSRKVYEKIVEAGFLVGKIGKILFFKPPYVIMEEHIEAFLSAFSEIIGKLGEENDR